MTPTTDAAQRPAFAEASAHKRTAYLAWLTVCLLWGTTYLGIRIALETIPPALLGGLRFTVAGLLLIALLAARGEQGDQQEAGHGEPKATEQRRWNGLERDADAEVRRAPQQADGEPREVRGALVRRSLGEGGALRGVRRRRHPYRLPDNPEHVVRVTKGGAHGPPCVAAFSR